MKTDTLDLIEKKLDGTLTDEEAATLADALSSDANLRSMAEDTEFVDRLISRFTDADPPSSLRASIMDSLPDNPSWSRFAAPAADRGAVSMRSRQTSRLRAAIFGTGGFSLGAVMAVLIMMMVSPDMFTDTVPDSAVTGTFAEPATTAVIDATIGQNGTVRIVPVDLGATTDLSIVGFADEPTTIRIEHGGGPIGVASYEWEVVGEDFIAPRLLTTDSIAEILVTGDYDVTIGLTRGTADVEVPIVITQGDDVQISETIRINAR